MQLISRLASDPRSKSWLVFPDLKECQVSGEKWPGKAYKSVTRTTIESALKHLDSSGSLYVSPWGSRIAGAVNNALGDVQLLGDTSAQSQLNDKNSPPDLIIGVQPGDGGPVEDWINFEALSKSSPATTIGELSRERSRHVRLKLTITIVTHSSVQK